MDACILVEKEIDKNVSKFEEVGKKSDSVTDDLLKHVEGIRNELSQFEAGDLSATHALVLKETGKKVRNSSASIGAMHRDLHGGVSKIGKAIDRHFVSDYGNIVSESALANEEAKALINRVICEHFLRHGMLDIAEKLVEEACIELDEAGKAPFREMHSIIDSLQEKNLDSAIKWAEEHEQFLKTRRSPLLFYLHRLRFVALIKQGPENTAQVMSYAQKMSEYSDICPKEFRRLMGCLMYIRTGLENSPYSDLLFDSHWQMVKEMFSKECCANIGLAADSPLSVSLAVGCKALPPLLNIKQVMDQRLCSELWTSMDELPVEIDLGSEHHYHSVFACPILRQQCTPDNPPVRLGCGHVISKEALHRLTSGNKLKCPYCPHFTSPSEARQIFL